MSEFYPAMSGQFSGLQIDTTACFQSSDVKNQIYYKIELMDYNQVSFWIFSPTASKSQMAKQIRNKFGEVYFVAESIIPHGQYVESFLSMSDRDLIKIVKEKRERILILSKVKKAMAVIVDLSQNSPDEKIKSLSLKLTRSYTEAVIEKSYYFSDKLDKQYEEWTQLRKMSTQK